MRHTSYEHGKHPDLCPVTVGKPAAFHTLTLAAMLVTRLNLALSRVSRPAWLRLPERHTTTTSLSRGTSLTRAF